MWLTFVITLIVLLLVFAGVSIRVLLLKDGEFHGTCSTNNEFNRRHNDGKCGVCGADADETCRSGKVADDAVTTAQTTQKQA